jgi:hypothetical protein
VTLPPGEEKQLLDGTTLMDVIAGCKTVGRVVGDIIVNGELKNPANFSRTTAY